MPLHIPMVAEGIGLIKEVEITEACQYVDITDLDINTHRFYDILVKLRSNITSTVTYNFYINNDYEATHYWKTGLVIDKTRFAGSGITNSPEFTRTWGASTYPEQGSITSIRLARDGMGYARAICLSNTYLKDYSGDMYPATRNSNIVKGDGPVSNITSIRIHSNKSTGIGVGSKIEVYGYKS